MDNIMIYGICALFGCFFALTFLLSRLKTDVFPENYEFQLDPFWYVWGMMGIGSIAVYCLFPPLADMVHRYTFWQLILPLIFAGGIYMTYLFDIDWLSNLLTLAAAVTISFLQPDDYALLPQKLSLWQERLVVALVLFAISKGLGLLNGLGGIAAMQFCAVMIAAVCLAYFGALPRFFAVLALAYLGTMVAFAFFSWPPEKIVMSHGGFSAIGFVLACFMLAAANEFAESSMLIACSYLFTEIGVAFYNHFLLRDKTEQLFMSTSYYTTSEQGKFELGVARGVLKILALDVLLACAQISASDRFALLFFAVIVNLWFLSILAGKTKPEELFSLTKMGKNAVKKIFKKKKDNL
ncbi:MAG: hypothetical protein IJ864_04155 [Alphaproteobacteria bacterium]|nr:hypothetical protein [Alphaproteobacteria bacterium]